MSGWKYVSIVVLVLLGGISYFGYWSFSQYQMALNVYDASYTQLSANFAAHTKVVLDRAKASVKETSSTVASPSNNFSLTSPVTEDNLYIGCHYKIAWKISSTTSTSTPSTKVTSLDIALVDAETQEIAGPIASGLSAVSTTTELDYLDWKVGKVWPGEFYLLVSRINDQETAEKSGMFTIQEAPEGKTPESFCRS